MPHRETEIATEKRRAAVLTTAPKPARASRVRLASAVVLASAAVAAAGWRIATVRVSPAPEEPRTPAQLILALERTARADPNPREAHEQLGAACLRLGHLLSARAAFRHAEELGSDSAWLRQQLAWCALRLDYREEAMAEYRRLLRREPHRPEGYLRLAAAAVRMGETAAARSTLGAMPPEVKRSLLTTSTPDAKLRLTRYLALLDAAGLPEECLRLARHPASRSGTDVTASLAAARASLRLGLPHDALRWAERAVHLTPERGDLHALRGDALLSLEEPKRRGEARAAFTRAITLQPTLGPAHYQLGRLALAAERWEEAARAFTAAHSLGTEPLASLSGVARAAEGAKQPLVALARRAEYLEEAGDTAAARTLYRRLLAHRGAALAATIRLADLDSRESRLREAIDHLEAATNRWPRSADVWRSLARTYRRHERVRDSLAAWRRAAALDAARAPEAYTEMAAIAESLADFDAAEQHYEECLRGRPDDSVGHRRYGTLLLLRRRLGDRLYRAIAQLERATASDPDDSAAFAALGRAYEAAGRDSEALIALRHSIDLAPGSGASYLALGRLARRLGRADEGREMMAMYRLYRQAEQQLEGLKAAVAAQPLDTTARLALAGYYFKARDFSRAASEYERGLSLGSTSLSPGTRGAARRRLGLTYERLARREDAATQLALAAAVSEPLAVD
jgi:tetratricopeptide (TPR) repeat protein